MAKRKRKPLSPWAKLKRQARRAYAQGYAAGQKDGTAELRRHWPDTDAIHRNGMAAGWNACLKEVRREDEVAMAPLRRMVGKEMN